MNELINSMRLIKMYAWEEAFSNEIKSVRKNELRQLRITAFVSSLSSTITPSITIIASVTTFIVLSAQGFKLNAQEAFTVFSLFIALQFTVITLPYAVKSLVESKVSFARLHDILMLPECAVISSDKSLEKGSVSFSSAEIFWKPSYQSERSQKQQNDETTYESKLGRKLNNSEKGDESPREIRALTNLNLLIQPGELLGVAGAVGSGKSALLNAINGEVRNLPPQTSLTSVRIDQDLVFLSDEPQERFDKYQWKDCLCPPKSLDF